MRITRFNNDSDNNENTPNCVIVISRTEAFRLIQNLLKQLETNTSLEEFKSNDGSTYFAIRSESESEPK